VDCNAEACRSLGYTREELLELSVKDFATDLLTEEEKRARRGNTLWERAVRDEPGKIVGFEENELLRKDGTTFPVEVGVGAIDYGGQRLIFASARDLTERKRAQEALTQERELLRTLIDNMPDFIFVKDRESRFVINNTEHARVLGAPEEELVGKTDFDVFSRDLAERYYADEQEIIRSGRALVDREEPVVDHAGNHRWLSTTKVPLRDNTGEISGLVGISRDITDRKALEEQLRHRAFHDPLTELPNRALFLDRLGHATARSGRLGKPIAVLFVDLDDFKRVNDSLGHEVGDRLLVEVGERLASSVRAGDTVARLFGDEFAVLIEAPTGIEETRRTAKRIQEGLRAPFTFDEQEVFVGCSIGIVLNDPDRAYQPREVLRHADLAMYAAKSRGKNRYEMFNPSMDARASERMELENQLRRAIEREEFEVRYQPIIELGSARVAGLEALARWRHPERGLLEAREFIQVAEHTGLIRPIGRRVFEEACRQAREWRERYPDRTILMCVNFSASQFVYQADLIPKVLSDTGLDPENLQLEITERAVMDDAEFSIGKLQRLKGLGMGFAIDDYGTGYSCLYYLKRMPVDSLKIDRSFVAGLGKDPGDDAIVSGTIDLAHALGLKVVAEGVETAEQLARLEDLGCDLAQGFFLSEPLSVEEASDLLANDHHW
jgi:diguanylate cyclase (GGDEF)-like protein/PAS domain S-box-containing protein